MAISAIGLRTLKFAAVASLVMATASAGLADNKTKENTITGALLGAGVGALIGDGKGAAIGGIAGAFIGHNWK